MVQKAFIRSRLAVAVLALGTLGFSSLTKAQTVDCRNEDGEFKNECSTSAFSAAAGGMASIYSIKRYSEIEKIEKKRSVIVYDFRDEAKALDPSLRSQMLHHVREGDKITIRYELSEAESRETHIRNLQKEIEELKRQGKVHLSESGKPGLGHHVGDSHIRLQTYAELTARRHSADLLFEKARAKEIELAEIKSGHPVELISVTEEIDTTKTSLNQWLIERIDKGSKLVWMKKLPASAVKKIAKLKNLSRGGAVGAAVGGAVAIGAAVSAIESDSNQEEAPVPNPTPSATEYKRADQ